MKTTIEMHFVKATKNTFRFEEQQFPDGDFKIGALYIQKRALGNVQPKGITVMIETHD